MFEPEILMKCNTGCASYLAAVNIWNVYVNKTAVHFYTVKICCVNGKSFSHCVCVYVHVHRILTEFSLEMGVESLIQKSALC